MKGKWGSGKAASIPKGLALGNGVSLGLTLLMSVGLAKLISTEAIQWDQIGYGILVILFISALLGSVISANAIKRQRLLVTLGAGMLFWLSLIVITALFFGGQYDGMLVTGGVILAASGTVALLGMRREAGKRSGSYRRKKR